MLDLLIIIIIIIILLLLLFFTRKEGYRIYPRDKKGVVTKVTNLAPNMTKYPMRGDFKYTLPK